MELENRNVKTLEIDVKDLFFALLKRIWISLLVAIVFFFSGLIYSSNFVTPLYTCKTQLFVISNNAAYSSASVTMDDNFTKNYVYLVKSNTTILNNVIEKNGLDMTPAQLSSKIKVSSPDETQLIDVSVTDPDPVMAKNISYSLCVEAQKYICEELIKADNITITETGELPTSPSSSSPTSTATKMGFLGFVLANVVLVILYFVNDTALKAEDVEKVLDMKVIGQIPHSHKLATKNSVSFGSKTKASK